MTSTIEEAVWGPCKACGGRRVQKEDIGPASPRRIKRKGKIMLTPEGSRAILITCRECTNIRGRYTRMAKPVKASAHV